MEKAVSFIRKNVVMCVALVAAVLTSFIVPPDDRYMGYFVLTTSHKEKYMAFTFVMQNIAANMGRIDAVRSLFSWLLEKSTLIFSVLSCQFISNVPSAILLSQFTDHYRELLLGVNIGGAGTLIASLASLITFREYTQHNPGKTRYYVGIFSAFNFSFLIVLTTFMVFFPYAA